MFIKQKPYKHDLARQATVSKMITPETLESWKEFNHSLSILQDFKRKINYPQTPLDDAKREELIFKIMVHSSITDYAIRLTQKWAHIKQRQLFYLKLHHECQKKWWAETEKRENQDRAYAWELRSQMRKYKLYSDAASEIMAKNSRMEKKLLVEKDKCIDQYMFLRNIEE